LVLAAALCGASCFSSSSETGDDGAVSGDAAACSLSSECPVGTYCGADRRCTFDCREARDCFGRGRCDPGSGRCLSDDAATAQGDGASFPADRGGLDEAGAVDRPQGDVLAEGDAAGDVASPDDAGGAIDLPAPSDATRPDGEAIDAPHADASATDLPATEDAGIDAATDLGTRADAGTPDAGAPDTGAPLDAPSADTSAPADVGSVDRPEAGGGGPADAGGSVCAPRGPSDGLWGWWRFDGDLRDSSGNGRDATVAGGAPVFAAGSACGAISIDPARPFVDLPDGRLQRATLAFFVRITAPAVEGAVFDGWTLSENLHASVVRHEGALRWSVGAHESLDASTWRPETHAYSSGAPEADRWVHLALTYDGGAVRLYVDGRLDASVTQAGGSYLGTVPARSDFRLGVDRTGARAFRGAIDELRLYERALTAEEVAALAGGATACAAGTHRCGDRCLADDSVASCGDRCEPCPTPPNGTATCEARSCRSTVVLQPGPGVGKDVWTTSVYSYAPGGGGPGGGRDDDMLRVGGWGDEYIALLEFDLRGLPAGPRQATLELYNGATTDPSSVVGMTLERITAPWDWRTRGTGSDRLRLWWADRPPGQRWGDALPAPTRGDWYRVDVTSLVTAWVGGVHPNHGLQLRPANTNHTFNGFYSSDHEDASRRPRLVIRY